MIKLTNKKTLVDLLETFSESILDNRLDEKCEKIGTYILNKCLPASNYILDIGTKLERWLTRTKFIRFISAAYLYLSFRSNSKENLLAYNQAQKGDLDYACKYFLEEGDYYGLLYVADGYLERAEEEIKKRSSCKIGEISDFVKNAFEIYTTKLGSHNWSDENLLRIANLYRENGFEKKALIIEDQQQRSSKRFNWFKLSSAPYLPNKNISYVFSFEKREAIIDALVSRIKSPIRRFKRRRELSSLNDRLLYGYKKIEDNDITFALEMFEKEKYFKGIEYMKKRFCNTEFSDLIEKTENDLIKKMKNDEIEKKILLKENIKSFLSKYS